MSRVSSILGRMQAVEPLSQSEIEVLARRAWRERGLALLDPSDVADGQVRLAVEAEATRRYGKRTHQKWK